MDRRDLNLNDIVDVENIIMPQYKGGGTLLHRSHDGEDGDNDKNDVMPSLRCHDGVVVVDDDGGGGKLLLERGVIATTVEPSSSSPNERRKDMNENNKDGYYEVKYPPCDTTTSHVQLGCIVLPIQVITIVPPDSIDAVNTNYEVPPTSSLSYCIGKTSRISLFAAYPPPFPVVVASHNGNRTTTTLDDAKNNDALEQQKRLLRRYSGWYGTTSIHTATTTNNYITNNDNNALVSPPPSSLNGSLGYAKSTISLNYRCPFFVEFPSRLSSVVLHNEVAQDCHGLMEMKVNKQLHHHHHQHQHHQQQQQCGKQRFRRRRRPQYLITDLHCTMHLDPATSMLPSIGTTLSTPNGRSQLRIDACSTTWLHGGRKRSKAHREADRRSDYYTICASHDFFHQHGDDDGTFSSWSSSWYSHPLPPMRAQCAVRLLPCPASLQSQTFLLALSTMNKELIATTGNYDRRSGNEMRRYDTRLCRDDRPRPDMTLCLGYGAPPSSFTWGEMLLNRTNATDDKIAMPHDYYFHAPIHDRDGPGAVVVVPSSSMYSSANLKLTMEQYLPLSSSIWHGTIEYLHAGRVLTFGTMMTRSFATSKFSRLGVGIRQSFYGICLNPRIIDINESGSVNYLWRWLVESGCATSWLFQLERGGVRLLVPVTLGGGGSTMIVSSWRTTLVGLLYASLASIIVDILVCELLCGVTSRVRLGLLRLLLGQECDKGNSSVHDDIGDHDDHWLDEQLFKTKEDALRQVNLMVRQARATIKKEDEMGGLVIIKAVYGVMDNKSRQWLSRSNRMAKMDAADINKQEADNTYELSTDDCYTMDATTQLQFWVTNSTLRLSELSKRHLLGFYDVMAYIGDDGSVAVGEDEQQATLIHGTAKTAFTRVLKRWWKGAPWFRYNTMKRRDLTVKLSIRYKYEDKIYDVTFDDNQAVELPNRFAQEVH